jgi:hypothetical protein
MLDLVYKLLKDDSNVTGEVSSRIYPYIREKDTTMPAVMMEFVGTEFTIPKEGISKADMYQVEVFSYAKTATVAMRLGHKVRAALVNKPGTYDMTGDGGFSYEVLESHIRQMSMESEAEGRVYVLVQVFDFVVSV